MGLDKAHKGYSYQDLLTCYFVLKDILNGNEKNKFSIDKKFIENDRFDDLVIINGKNIQRKQIKYSEDKELIKNDFSNDSRDLAIYELFNSWKILKITNSEFRLCLSWSLSDNKNIRNILKRDENITSSFISYPTNIYKFDIDNLWDTNSFIPTSWRKLKEYVEQNSISRDEFKSFCDSLIIELDFPKENHLKEIVLNQIIKLGIGKYPNQNEQPLNFLERFAKKINDYRGDFNREVSISKVLKDLVVQTEFGKIEQKFEIDQLKNIKKEDKFKTFAKNIEKLKKTILLGEPGSGKSWFLTNFIEYLEAKKIKVIRHYCFTSTNYDVMEENRVTSDVFFGNLVADIIKKFPKLKNTKEHLYVADLDELNILLSHIKEELVIIIDGLDHIERVFKNSINLSEDKVQIIDFISKINTLDNTSIVVSSQPVEEIKVLVEEHEYLEYKISKWDENDTLELMEKFSFQNKKLKGIEISKMLLEKSEGSPLYLTYLIKTLKLEKIITKKKIKQLPKYDFNLEKYYDYIVSKLKKSLTAQILACLDFTVTKDELKEILDCISDFIDEDLEVLSPVISDSFTTGGIKLYHDSFRRYNLDKFKDQETLNKKYLFIIDWLEKKGFYKNQKAYRYLLSYFIKAQKFKSIKKYATDDFLFQSLYNGFSQKAIEFNYNNFLIMAKNTKDFTLFIYISELNRSIFNISTEQYSMIEEHFEDYFYSIGLVFGFKKANELLFFDGKSNFDNELISKAFYILRSNGHIPNWNKLDDFFKGKIEFKNFNSYIYYLIDTNKLDGFTIRNIKKLEKEKNHKFLRVFISEVYFEFGISKILEFIDLVEEKDKIIKTINDILFDINATESIRVNQKVSLSLTKLSKDIFDEKYYNNDKLDELYQNLENYTYQDLEKLKQFNKTFKLYDFFDAWVRFTINLFIIENDASIGVIKTYKEFEEKLIDNFENFLHYTTFSNLTHDNRYIIQEPIFRMLKYIKTRWKDVVDIVSSLYNSSHKMRYFFYVGVLDEFKCDKNIKFLIKQYEGYTEEEENESEGYSFQIDRCFEMVSLYSFAKEDKKAKKELKKAILYMTAYGHRKDTTLNEIREPLEYLKDIDSKFALSSAKKLLPLNLAVQNHSENGKGIKWLYIYWFEDLVKIDFSLASSYLVSELLDKPYYWKLDDMYMYLLHESKGINPIILNFLYKLSPTNVKDLFIEDFLDNTNKLISLDSRLAYQSVVNILARDLNNSYEKLSKKTTLKLNILRTQFKVSKQIPVYKDNNQFDSDRKKEILDIIKENCICENQLFNKNEKELVKQIDRYGIRLSEINFLSYKLNNEKDKKIVKEFFIKLIRVKYPSDSKYYDRLYTILKGLDISKKSKIYLMIEIFVHSRDGWLSCFSHTESFLEAIKIDKKKALIYLSRVLVYRFNRFSYFPSSTSNLLKAFCLANIEIKIIKKMYKRGFDFISYRIPLQEEYNWENLDDSIESFTKEEMIVLMIFIKLKNLDTTVQKEAIYAINYLMNYEASLLIKPINWFLENHKYFPQLSISSVTEVLLLHIDKNEFFSKVKNNLIELKK